MTDEILVHISTAATKQNDNLYRSLADAYLDFEPYQSPETRHDHRAVSKECSNITRVASPQISYDGTSDQVLVDTPILSTTKDSYGSFPSHLSSECPSGNRELSNLDMGVGSSGESFVAPSSRLAQLERIQANHRKHKAPRSSFASEQDLSTRTLVSTRDQHLVFIEDTQLAARAVQSQLFDIYSTTSEDTSEDDAEFTTNDRNTTVSTRCSYPNQNSDGQVAGLIPMSQALENTGRNDAGFYGSIAHGTPPQTSAAVISPMNEPSQVPSPNAIGSVSLAFIDFSKLPFDAFPPAPEISIMCPGSLPSQVTKHLEAIKRRNPNRFKPLKSLRKLDADERGYWAMECSDWSPKVQHDFWRSLSEQIRSGRLGWGVTLHRESHAARELGEIRLYCWGEVVEHIWLFLWLCSRGSISALCSAWFDAQDNMIIQMR